MRGVGVFLCKYKNCEVLYTARCGKEANDILNSVKCN